jgi:membrane-bound serine protease (ClpP class)
MVKYTLSALLFFSITLQAIAGDSSAVVTKNSPVLVVIPVEGTVNAGMASFLSRAIKDSRQYKDRVLVFEMDTYGGEVDAAFQIVDTIVNVKDAPTIAFVKTKAISAGALIALSCNKLVMKPNTTIGDVAPLTMSNDGPQMLGEKFQSPIRAKFRTLAKKNGYPEALTEAMVTSSMVVYKVKLPDTTLYLDSIGMADLSPAVKKSIISTSTVVKKGELLTMDDSEAHKLGFSRMSVSSIEQMAQEMGYKDAKIIRIAQSWSENFVRFIGTIAPILMMIGFAALYIEIKTPGFGLPGIIGISCLALVFFSQYMVGLADYTDLLFLLTGAALILIEVFVTPGFGLIGFAGIALMIIGMILSFQNFTIPRFPWQRVIFTNNAIMVFGSITGAAVVAVLFFKFVFVRLGKVIKGPYLEMTLQDAHIDSETYKGLKTGDSGIVVSSLRPAGRALINGENYDVVADGEFIDKGTRITVSCIDSNRIVCIRERIEC